MITLGIVEVDLLGELLGHAAGGHRVDLRAEHHVPADRRVDRRDRLEHLDRLADRGVLAAELAGDREPEQTGVDQGVDDERRAPPEFLGLVAAPADHVLERRDSLEQAQPGLVSRQLVVSCRW